jgi:hypothetical protein
MRRVVCACIGSVVIFGAWSAIAPTAKADKGFRDEFIAMYVKADSDKAKDKDFAEACEKAKCTICHVGVKKKDRNSYGKQLGKLLSRETDAENKEKIRAALTTVAKLKSDPEDEKSPTFGELISRGKLPGAAPK